MKSVRVSTKALLAFIVTLILAVSFSVNAFAAERYENCGNRYGRIIPTDEKLEAQVFDYYFKGDSAPIHFMRMSTGEPGACYAVEIYADAEYTTLIKYLSREYDTTAGHSPVAINLSFDGLRSGTYYGRCYTYVTRSDGTIYDLDSVQNFNIHIDRLSNKTVVLTGAHNTDAGISVSWIPNATATQYHLCRRVNGSDWEYVTALGEGVSNYVDTNVYNGNTYTYTLYCSDGGYSSTFDPQGVSVIRLSTPTLNSVAANGPQGYAGISWSAVDSADGYYVYRKGGSLSSYDWQLIADVKGCYSNYYVDVNSTSTNWSYNYTVVAYKGGSTSSYNPVGLEFNYMPAPILVNAVSNQYGVYIEWQNSNRKTQGYNVYRRTWNTEWEYIGSTTETGFTDVNAVSGIDYIYTVVGYCATNTSAYSDNGIALRYVATPHLNSVTFDEYTTAIVSWDYVGGADRYQVFRKLSNEANWTFVGDAYDTVYYDSIEKVSGETYTYTVIAYSGSYSSTFDAWGGSGCFLAAPAVSASNVFYWDTSAVQIDWNYINGATKYDVYRCDYDLRNWVRIAEGVTSNSFVDYTTSAYSGYSYAVIASNDYSSSHFNVAPIVAVPTVNLEYCVIGNEGGVHLGWSALVDGSVYYVFRKTVDGAWENVGTTTTNYFVDWSAEAVSQYYIYTVVAEAYGYTSSFDSLGIANFAEVRSLNGVLAEGEAPYITVNWELDGFTQWYELIRTVNGESVSLGVFTADSGVTQYVDTDIVIGNVYTYSIVANAEGRFSKTNSIDVKYPLPAVPAVQISGVNAYVNNGVANVDIAWGFVDYAESYTVYRRTDSTDWVALATLSVSDLVNGPIYTDTTAEFDVNYYYAVMGFAPNRDSNFDGVGVNAIVLKPIEHPYGVTVREDIINTQTVAIVGWDAVDKAEYYNVYRKDATSDWVYLGTIWDGSCSFIDNTIVQGVKYTYTVSAVATGRGEAANPVGANYRWNINDEGIVPADYTGLHEHLGTWYYFVNGRIDWYSDTLVNHNGTWLYAYRGEVAWDYTGLVLFGDVWYYVINGQLDTSVTTLVCAWDTWFYVENGAINWAYTGLVDYYGTLFYVENGILNWNSDTLVMHNGIWHYAYQGQVAWDYTGLVLFGDVWYYVINGQLDTSVTTLVCAWDTWFYVENGAINWAYTGIVEYNGELFYVENGVLNWASEAVATYEGVRYYVRGGKVAWDYTGDVFINNLKYIVTDGIVSDFILDLNPVY